MSDVEHPSATALSGDVEKAARDSSQAATGISSPHVDNSDPDEALKLVAGEAVVLTPEDEKRLLRKIDRNMMPLLCVVYGLNYLDKTTLSYASVMGIRVRCLVVL